jgi:SAM-dependent methyltransferase
MSTSELPVDVDVLRDEIQKTYTDVSAQPEQDFIFPTGRAWAEDLGYPQPELANVPDASVQSFAGVANPHVLGRIEEGSVVLDLGCGAGTDLLIAAQMVGSEGHVIGVDMTPGMLRLARASATEMGISDRVEVHESLIESLPLPNAEVDIVISNGVIDLVPEQGRRVRGDRSGPEARRPPPARRRRDPYRSLGGRAQAHRPLDWLNCRSSPGRRARAPAGSAGLHGHQARGPRRYLRTLDVRGHTPQGREVRRDGVNHQGNQTGSPHI